MIQRTTARDTKRCKYFFMSACKLVFSVDSRNDYLRNQRT